MELNILKYFEKKREREKKSFFIMILHLYQSPADRKSIFTVLSIQSVTVILQMLDSICRRFVTGTGFQIRKEIRNIKEKKEEKEQKGE